MAKNTTPTIPAAYTTTRDNGPATRSDASRAEHVATLGAMLDTFCPALIDAFAAVNGKADSFTLNSSDAITASIDAEKALASKGVPKALRAGTHYTVSSAGPAANAYKYGAIGTRFTLRRNTKGDWSLVSVERITVHPKQSGREYLTVTLAARDAIIRQALDGVAIHAALKTHYDPAQCSLV